VGCDLNALLGFLIHSGGIMGNGSAPPRNVSWSMISVSCLDKGLRGEISIASDSLPEPDMTTFWFLAFSVCGNSVPSSLSSGFTTLLSWRSLACMRSRYSRSKSCSSVKRSDLFINLWVMGMNSPASEPSTHTWKGVRFSFLLGVTGCLVGSRPRLGV
jgi:hypothetical protein